MLKKGSGTIFARILFASFCLPFFLEGVKVQSGSEQLKVSKLKSENRNRTMFAQSFVSVENLFK